MVSGEKSKAAFARAKNLFPGGVNSPVRAFRSVGSDPFVVDRGEGAFLRDIDGNRYVDYVLSWGPLVLGHAHPAVVEAIQTQAAHGTSFGACCREESELAELIMELYPSMEMLRFVNSGTEAGMSVVRLARAFTSRNKIIKFAGCYHGHVDSLLVQAGSGVATLGLPDCAGVPQGFTGDTLTAPFNDLEAVSKLFAEFPGQIAAVLIEPVVGNAGLILPELGFLQGLSELCTQNGALFILDEVMTGFRVALGGAQALYGVRPDLTMLGKVIGGGLPVGAFGGRKEIMSMLAPLGPVYQAGTLSGNPLAMAAGAATLKEWTRPGVFESAAATAVRVVEALKAGARQRGIPLTAGQAGTMFGFFFREGPVRNYAEAKGSDIERFKRFFHLMLESGVFLAPSQFEAGFVSAVHEGDPLDVTLGAIERSFLRL